MATSKNGAIDRLKTLAEFLQNTGDREQLALASVLFGVLGAYRGGSIFDLLSYQCEFTQRDIVRMQEAQAEIKTKIEIAQLENLLDKE